MGYYSTHLAAERLRRCYEIAPTRVRRYLRAEIDFVLSRSGPAADVLELGCGYGRKQMTACTAAGEQQSQCCFVAAGVAHWCLAAGFLL